MPAAAISEFQSRNRGSFLFKELQEMLEQMVDNKFQSRNRGSFLFKSVLPELDNTLFYFVSIS